MISVIIPTYKNRGGLNESIDSVFAQTYSDFEIIVVDDNFPDSDNRKATEKIMSQYLNNKQVFYIKHIENRNGAAARNTGIKAAKGQYIAFLDDDDIFFPEKLSKQKEYLDNHKEFDAVYCLAQRDKFGCPQDVLIGNGTRKVLMKESNFYTPSLMFRKEALDAINGFDESFRRHQDLELLLRFFSQGFLIGCVEEQLIKIGLNAGENSPSAKKLEELKKYFFDKFSVFLEREEAVSPGFKNKVFAKHYASVFLKYLKERKLKDSLRIFNLYFGKSPATFLSVLFFSIKAHI